MFESNGRVTILDFATATGRTIATGHRPQWLRTEDRIVFARGDALYSILPTGLDERLVLQDTRMRDPAWAPNDSRIAFVIQETNWVLHVLDANGGLAVPVSPPDPANRQFFDRQPAWSPDGGWLTFIRVHEVERQGRVQLCEDLMIVSATGRDGKALTDCTASWQSPSW